MDKVFHRTTRRPLNGIQKQRNKDAQYNVGTMYYNGQSVSQDYKKAFEWYMESATQGDAQAQSAVAAMYLRGLGIKQDNKTALQWYTKAAKQGYADAQNNLGVMYE